MKHVPLDAKKLRLTVDPQGFAFERLSEVKAEAKGFLAQERAVRALTFGLRMRHADFNVYVAGIKETGLADIARTYVEEIAKDAGTTPSDWCYLNNFKNADMPLAVELPKGKGRELKQDMTELVDNLKLQIPKLFESETYVTQKEEVIRAFNKDRHTVFEDLDLQARSRGFILQSDQSGMMVVPAKEDGTPMTSDDIANLSEEQRNRLKVKTEELHKEMGNAMRRIHQLEQEVGKRLKDLDRKLVGQIADNLLEPLKEKYSYQATLGEYFAGIRDDVVQRMEDFNPKGSGGTPSLPFPSMEPSFAQYAVNVLVDNSETEGAPVVIEGNPIYANLFGKAEKKAQFGALFTDFTMIKPGAFHQANGGYLLIKAMDLLKSPFSYEAMKRALREKKLEIEDVGEYFGFTTKTLKPMPIPLQIKIVLVGDPYIYQLLYNYDEDFRELFKVKAHLDVHVERDQERLDQFLQVAKSIAEKEGLQDLDGSAVARLIEYSAELAGSQEKLSLRVTELADLIREADFWAGRQESAVITREHIQKAIDEKTYRSSLYEDHLQELLTKDILKVTTSGRAVGQVNGLAIYDLGDHVFAKPSRITVNVSLGKEGVVNIEREADLSGSIHTKGVMILSGYLRARFAAHRPLSLSASIAFEQSYGLVEGDSASAAELFALISALSGVSIDQGIACTGAVSQKGEILPVGGVTRKIEGFFDLCEARGLTGNQGVIVPEANVKDLMLKSKVVEAVGEGEFQIWAVGTVEEGVEILTGQPAGISGPDGTYPDGTVFAKVDEKLQQLAEEARCFMTEAEEEVYGTEDES